MNTRCAVCHTVVGEFDEHDGGFDNLGRQLWLCATCCPDCRTNPDTTRRNDNMGFNPLPFIKRTLIVVNGTAGDVTVDATIDGSASLDTPRLAISTKHANIEVDLTVDQLVKLRDQLNLLVDDVLARRRSVAVDAELAALTEVE